MKHGILDSFETKEGELNGSLKLKYCLVSTFPDSTSEEIRHALIITEYKKGAISNDAAFVPSDSKIISKYILCAENDTDRNDWISYMEAHINKLRQVAAAPDVIVSTTSSANVAMSTKLLPMTPAPISRAPTDKSQSNNNDTLATKTEVNSNRTSFGYKSNSSLVPAKKFVDDNERVLSKPAALTFIVVREKTLKKVSSEKNMMRAALGGVFKRKPTAGILSIFTSDSKMI